MTTVSRISLFTRFFLFCVLLSLLLPAGAATAEDDEKSKEQGLQYRLIGPATGGRASRVTGVAGDPLTYYLATAAGGVWKTINGGMNWQPIFDDQPISSIGSVAVAASDPNIVYVGSGEANIRGNVGEGNGIYRSTDGGQHWTHVWAAEGQIGTIAIHPRNPDIVFAAVLGSPFGPGEERGVYRTMDGGENWQKVLYVDADSGASDVAFNENNPNILFAGMWQTRRQPWSMASGGAGSGLYVSRDGGENWKRLQEDGLPDGIWGRIGVRVARSNADRVYALIEAEEGGLFRSDDGGESWRRVNHSHGLRQRAWYYTTLTIDPTDADTVWFPNVRLYKTLDGGDKVFTTKGGGWDYHDVWIDPANTQRIAIASDAGVSLSRDGGKSWMRPPLPLGQFYHLSVDTRTPYYVMGSLQDLGTRAAPSNSLREGGILLSDWRSVGGGEAGYVVAKPDDPRVVYAGEYLGYLSRYDARTGQSPHMGIYPDNGSGHGAVDLKHRFQWTAPIHISPHNPDRVYHASNTLQRTHDGGQSWEIISPDLTRDDASKQAWSGGPITGDNTGVEFYSTIFALAESPVEAGIIWTGSDDGLVHISRDDGASWTNVTPKGVPEWGTVAVIEASRWAAGTAYVVVDAHRLDDERPYLWKTENFGRSWQSLSGALDPEVYLHVVREDRQQQGMLYLGTERGVMYTLDDGDSWESLRLNMPTVAIADLAVTANDLVVGTLGRSAWILDDLSPLRAMNDEIASKKAHLFKPLPATRWTYDSEPGSFGGGGGDNPPKGASVTYYLAAPVEEDITLVVLDGQGAVIRRLSSELEAPFITSDHPDWNPDTEFKPDLTTDQGMNRAVWDLRHEGAERITGSTNDAGNVDIGPLVAPGEYRLRLTVGGKTMEQPLTVIPDPRASGDSADLDSQIAFSLTLRDRISTISKTAVRIRDLKEQLQARHERLAAKEEASELLTRGKALLEQLEDIEKALYNPNAKVNYDILAGRDGGAKLYSRYGWLYLTGLDHNGPPTQGMWEVAGELSQLFNTAQGQFDSLLENDVKTLNRLAMELGLGYVF